MHLKKRQVNDLPSTTHQFLTYINTMLEFLAWAALCVSSFALLLHYYYCYGGDGKQPAKPAG